MRSLLLLTVGLISALIGGEAAGQEKGEPGPAPQVIQAPPARFTVKRLQSWSGTVLDPKLRDVAPTQDHVITNNTTWAKVWKAWHGENVPPAVNFEEELILVFTANGPNSPCLGLHQSGGNISGVVGRTVKGGPGFGYRIVKVSRKGVTSFFGQPIE